jgi:hypothetical protein
LWKENVTMTIDEARQVMSRYARWVDESPVYDNDGYAAATWTPAVAPVRLKAQTSRDNRERAHPENFGPV